MKGLFVATVAALAVSSAAFADGRKPTKMTEAQLDQVVAGQIQIGSGLVTVQVGDVTVDVPVRVLNNSVNNNTVQIPVAANVGAAVAVLGNARALAQQFGRQN
jgi:hypothetical protein